MALKKLGSNAKCGCGSGQKYKRCCLRTGVPWFVDERGTVIDAGLAQHAQATRVVLGALYERDRGEPMRLGAQAQEVYQSMSKTDRIDYLMGVGLPADVIYAYETTDIFVPVKWYNFFRQTNVVPLTADGDMSYFAPAIMAIIDHDRVAGGDSVPDPEYLTLNQVVAEAKKHRPTMDKSGSVHMMQPTECRGCRFTNGLLELTAGMEDVLSRESLLVTLLDEQVVWQDGTFVMVEPDDRD